MIIEVGMLVRVDGDEYEVVATNSATVRLRERNGHNVITYGVGELSRLPELEIGGVDPSAKVAAAVARLAVLPEEARDGAMFWYRHLTELLTGSAPDGGGPPNPRYDVSLPKSDRVASKSAELRELGAAASVAAVWRKLRAFDRDGIVGLVDQRTLRTSTATGRVDSRVVEVVVECIAAEEQGSTGTRSRLIHRAKTLIQQRFSTEDVPLPSDATWYRLLDNLSHGKHTFGAATTRRSLANRPDRAMESMKATRPGEQVQIDSTPLDILVLFENGKPYKADLTIMLDVATRSIMSAVLRPVASKSIDISVALAHTLVPELSRPGGLVGFDIKNTGLGSRKLMPVAERTQFLNDRPYIVPETITTDRGRTFLSENFVRSCEIFGIGLNTSAPYTPTDKAMVERTFRSINTLFCQYAVGYTGGSVANRGRSIDTDQVWPLVAIQELLNEWVAAIWQNRRHDGLRDPLNPAHTLTPNEIFQALQAVYPQVHVPFSPDVYIGMLDVQWRTIQAQGVTIGNRTYDAPELQSLRHSRSGLNARDGKWEVRVDPYNIHFVWLRASTEWIQLRWVNAPVVGAMSQDVWKLARNKAIEANRGARASEADVTLHAADLLNRVGDISTASERALARNTTALAQTGTDTAEPMAKPVAMEPANTPAAPIRRLSAAPITPFDPNEDMEGLL